MTLKNTLIAVLLVASVVTAGVQPVAAQSDEGFWDGFAEDGETAGGTACFIPGDDVTFADCNREFLADVSATVDRIQYTATSVGSSSDEDESAAEEYATDLTKTYNDNSAAIEEYVNARTNDSTTNKTLTVELTFAVDDSEATRYLVADVANGTFENSSVVEETTRESDFAVSIQDFAAANAADELDRFVTDYVDGDKEIDRGYLIRMGSRYGDNIDIPEEYRP